MGTMKHSTLVVYVMLNKHIELVHCQAREIYREISEGSEELVSDVVPCIVNGGGSFFIAPDGSKEGWEDSDLSDEARKKFLEWIIDCEYYFDVVEIDFGGDDNSIKVNPTLEEMGIDTDLL